MIPPAADRTAEFAEICRHHHVKRLDMCGGGFSRDLMALNFSHTFLLNRPVPPSEVRRVFEEDGLGWSLQGPRKLPSNTYRKLFELGYQMQS